MELSPKIQHFIMGLIGIVFILLFISSFAPDITNSTNNLSSSALPLTAFFGSKGVILTILMTGILLGLIPISINIWKKND